MLGIKDIEQIISVKPIISDEMVNAISLWSDMYENRAPWLKEPKSGEPEKVVSLGLPALIASEKARLATIEMESEITPPMVDVEKENPDYKPPGVDENGMVTMGSGSMTITESEPAGPTERAEFLNQQYKKLKKQIRRQLEYGIAKGGLVIKPYVISYTGKAPSISTTSLKVGEDDEKKDTIGISELGGGEKKKPVAKVGEEKEKSAEELEKADSDAISSSDPLPEYEIEFDFIQADRFYPLSFDNNGKITEAAFTQQKVDKEKVYTRVEYHKLEGRSVTVQNFAYVADNNRFSRQGLATKDSANFGKPCQLTEVPEWAGLAPSVTIDNVDRPLFAYFKMPEANTIDPYSPLGVSGFSRATSLIKDADEQYSRLLWEYEGGEMAIDVDRDALKMREYGDGSHQTVLPSKQERLFRKVDLNSDETYNVFAPPLRDESIRQGLNTILVRIEDAVGFSRGTISEDPSYEAKTATEMKIQKQRSYSTNRDIQSALEDALRDSVYVADVYCTLYNITPAGKYEISFEWDDSIIVDSEAELEKRLSLINAGISSKLETRMWYFGETENQAKAALQQVDDEKKSSMETNITAQQELGALGQGKDFSGDNNNPSTPKNLNNSEKKITTAASQKVG